MPRGKNLKDSERLLVFVELVGRSDWTEQQSLEPRHIADVAKMFGRAYSTIVAIWEIGVSNYRDYGVIDVRSRIKFLSGAKLTHDRDVFVEAVSALSAEESCTQQDIVKSLDNVYSLSYVSKMHQAGLIKCMKQKVKPPLTDYHRVERLCHALDLRQPDNPELYKDMYDEIHCDEWWGRGRVQLSRYTGADSPPEYVGISPKKTANVMNISFIYRPRTDPATGEFHNGLLGMATFTAEVVAQRNSTNRPKGTIEHKSIKVNKEVIVQCFIDVLLPAVQALWPESWRNRPVYIVMDNASPHAGVEHDPRVKKAFRQSGLDLRFKRQPPQSPDCNANDLGFINMMKKELRKKKMKNNTDMIDVGATVFHSMDPDKLNRLFLSKMLVCNQIIKHCGGNEFELLHMGKESHKKNGTLPTCIAVTPFAMFFDEYLPELELMAHFAEEDAAAEAEEVAASRSKKRTSKKSQASEKPAAKRRKAVPAIAAVAADHGTDTAAAVAAAPSDDTETAAAEAAAAAAANYNMMLAAAAWHKDIATAAEAEVPDDDTEAMADDDMDMGIDEVGDNHLELFDFTMDDDDDDDDDDGKESEHSAPMLLHFTHAAQVEAAKQRRARTLAGSSKQGKGATNQVADATRTSSGSCKQDQDANSQAKTAKPRATRSSTRSSCQGQGVKSEADARLIVGVKPPSSGKTATPSVQGKPRSRRTAASVPASNSQADHSLVIGVNQPSSTDPPRPPKTGSGRVRRVVALTPANLSNRQRPSNDPFYKRIQLLRKGFTPTAKARVARLLANGLDHPRSVSSQEFRILCCDNAPAQQNESENWLRGDHINAYRTVLNGHWAKRAAKDPASPKCFFYNSYLHDNWKEDPSLRGLNAIICQGGDMFALDMGFVAINITRSHWTVVLILPQSKLIQYVDSSGGNDSYRGGGSYCQDVYGIVEYAYKMKHGQDATLSGWTIDGASIVHNQQTNWRDCGVFSLINAEVLSTTRDIRSVHSQLLTQAEVSACQIRDRMGLSFVTDQPILLECLE